MRPQDTITLGVCDPGTVNSTFALHLFQLGREYGPRIGDVVHVIGSGLLSRIRNDMVHQFLERNVDDWLLMVDSDEMLTGPVFKKLVDAASYAHRPVIAGLVFAAYPPEGGDIYPTPRPSIFRLKDDTHEPILDYPRDTVIPVDAAGTGCLLVHRRVLEAIRANTPAAPMWGWFQDGPMENGRWISEDLTFCARVRAAGFPLHAHTGAVLPHRKSYWVSEPHFDDWLSRRSDEQG